MLLPARKTSSSSLICLLTLLSLSETVYSRNFEIGLKSFSNNTQATPPKPEEAACSASRQREISNKGEKASIDLLRNHCKSVQVKSRLSICFLHGPPRLRPLSIARLFLKQGVIRPFVPSIRSHDCGWYHRERRETSFSSDDATSHRAHAVRRELNLFFSPPFVLSESASSRSRFFL